MGLGDSLVRKGVVSAQALAHAEGVQKRGYRTSSVFDLLVDLDHMSEEEMASTLASMTGSSVWDGTSDEPAGTVRGVVITRIEGRRCWYATANPIDEEQRDAVRFQTGAREVIPLTATRTQIADAKIGVTMPEWPEIDERYGTVPAERMLREELAEEPPDAPLVRLTNSWLLLTCGAPGRTLVIRAFNPPVVAVGRLGALRPLASGGRNIALRSLYRIALMGRAALGPGARSGHLRLMLGLGGGGEEFRIDVATTRSGESLVCQRVVSYAGMDGVAGTPIAALRQAWEGAESAEDVEPILRSILERATDSEVLDRIWALEMLGTLLGASGRESRAREHFEEGLALIHEHGIGGRAEAVFRVGLALSEISDLKQRANCFSEANARLNEEGPGRFTFHGAQLGEAESRLHCDELDAAVDAARALVSRDRRRFGARSSMGVTGLAIAAEALARLGDIEEATGMITKLDASWCPPDEWIAAYARGKVEAAAEHHRNAVDCFRRALALPGAHVLWVAAALANELLALGKRKEAVAVARGVDEVPFDAFDERAAVELERIRKMSPYR